jgi:hypothetical protein
MKRILTMVLIAAAIFFIRTQTLLGNWTPLFAFVFVCASVPSAFFACLTGWFLAEIVLGFGLWTIVTVIIFTGVSLIGTRFKWTYKSAIFTSVSAALVNAIVGDTASWLMSIFVYNTPVDSPYYYAFNISGLLKCYWMGVPFNLRLLAATTISAVLFVTFQKLYVKLTSHKEALQKSPNML